MVAVVRMSVDEIPVRGTVEVRPVAGDDDGLVVVDAVVVPVVENDIALGGVAGHERAGSNASTTPPLSLPGTGERPVDSGR